MGSKMKSRIAVTALTLALGVMALTSSMAGCGGNEPKGGYDQGPYHCCDPDQGTSCCSGYRQGFCFAYGGTSGACRGPGDSYDGKDICSLCCDGLQAASVLVPTMPGASDDCGPPASGPPPGNLICIACGDGECGAGESRCNCPSDCPQ